ncbi:hypothetical protein N836_31655 [Leptolyngbya sp. Heron Island J]|nr:hypothetical protein N836_31655 [Leptolyngbya sp. Heron Island J]
MDLYERPQLEGEPVYGIFLYGPLKATLPSIATVAFPDIKWKIFLDKIDLLKRHPGFFGTNELDVEVQYEPRPEVGDLSPEEIIPEPDLPIIRRRPAEEEG